MHLQIYSARESELIEGLRRNDRSSQKTIYEQMAGKMLSLCSRYVKTRMEAEDMLVTSFTKVFDRIDQFKGEGSFEGWVRRIVVNECLSYLRKSKYMYLETDLEAAEREPNLDDLNNQLEAEDLLKLIAGLPAGYQIVFNMFAIDGYSHKEIAEHLGINENTSKSQLSRARGHLQARLLEIEKGIQHTDEDNEKAG